MDASIRTVAVSKTELCPSIFLSLCLFAYLVDVFTMTSNKKKYIFIISLFVSSRKCNQQTTVLVLKTNHNHYYCIIFSAASFFCCVVYCSLVARFLCWASSNANAYIFLSKIKHFVILGYFMFGFVCLNDNARRKETHQVSDTYCCCHCHCWYRLLSLCHKFVAIFPELISNKKQHVNE